MFTVNPCAAGCGKPAITGSVLCFSHQANPQQEYSRICDYIKKNPIIKDFTVSEMNFYNVDFSKRHFYGCNFIEASFYDCNFSGIKIRMSFFDFSKFSACNFSGSDIQFLSYAGSDFSGCDFSSSEIVHCNFEGAVINETSFNYSNLYNSRFIRCDINKSTFIDCNLKRVHFGGAKQEDILFKASNTAEAIFEMEEK
ncbi:MAG: pentapeptide repeat-containing protein [Treponema sp.]|nr:pentapeptide repeat-containing protein [Treponema sp.]